MRNQSENSKLLEARESANDQVANVFSFEFDWLREWRKYSEPITVKLKPSQITFDTIENCSNHHVLIGQRISLGFVLRQSLKVYCGSIEIV